MESVEFIEVGKRGKFNGVNIKCVENTGQGCQSCIYESDCGPRKKERPACMANESPDRKSVYFLSSKT